MFLKEQMRTLTLAGIIMAWSFTGCNDPVAEEKFMPPEPGEWIVAEDLRIPVYDFDGLQPFLERKNDTLYVVNFWASWCKPCVEEMPYLLEAEEKYRDSGLRLLLVSLDFKSEAETELIPFMKRHGLGKQVILLSDPDANAWINRVNEQWSGAIPATLFYKNGKEYFYEGTLTRNELEEIIEQYI